jgi:hypothetical protein
MNSFRKSEHGGLGIKALSYRLSVCVTVLAVLLYAVSAFLYNIPDGYGKDRIGKTNSLMDPLFTQNWSLFAPEAPLTDVGFLARIKIDGKEQEYLDISSPALDEEKGKILPDRKYRLLNGAFVAYVQAEEGLYNAINGESSYPGVFMASSSEISSIMDAEDSVGKKEKDNYRSMTELFKSVVSNFLEGEGFDSRYLCETGRSIQVRLVGVPISGMSVRGDEVEVRDLPWVSC